MHVCRIPSCVSVSNSVFSLNRASALGLYRSKSRDLQVRCTKISEFEEISLTGQLLESGDVETTALYLSYSDVEVLL